MKQTTKITLLSIWSIINTIVIIIVTVLCTIKFAWRIAPDFSLCEDPEKIRPAVGAINKDHVRLDLTVPGLGFNFEGYTHKWEQNKSNGGYTLYVGVKYIPLLGNGGQGDFIYIPKSSDQRVTKIVACGHGKERVIYDSSSESDQDKLQDSTNTSSEATSS